LIPDAELQVATYNQIFTGQEFALKKEAKSALTLMTKEIGGIQFI
jgi:hypothetical protein